MDDGVSVIILTLNNSGLLNKLLRSFLDVNTHKPIEIIIVNHDSKDEIDEVISSYVLQATFLQIKREKNFTFSESCNYAATKARFPYLLFINDDIVYTADVLPAAVARLRNDFSIGAVGVRLDDYPGSLPENTEPGIQHLGIEFKWSDKYGYFRPEQIRHPNLKDFDSSLYPSALFHAVTGAFLLCRKIDFEALSGFSESYDYGLEDIDFCLRLGRDLMKKCYCINDISLQHTEGATRKIGNPSVKSQRRKRNHAVFREIWADYVCILAHEHQTAISSGHYLFPNQRKNINNVSASLSSFPATLPLCTILLVLPGPIESNNGYHAQLLARSLKAHGVQSIIASPAHSPAKQAHGSSQQHNDGCILTTHDALLRADAAIPAFDIIHAWTPRENVRVVSEQIVASRNCPLVIHLEDNEEFLTESTVGRPWAELAKLPEKELAKLIPKHRYHPCNGPAFLEKATALTMVIDNLGRFNIWDVPIQILPPMVDERLFYPRPLNMALRKELGILDGHVVLAYTGNVHKGNVDEVRELYQAVELLNERGCPTVLLRSGLNSKGLGVDNWSKKYEKHLGWVERERVPEILAAADVLVQPGMPGPFNDERIPCKLLEYFAMGRPVILPRTNLGLKVEHGVEGYVLDKADAEGISLAVRDIQADPQLACNLGGGSVDLYLAFRGISNTKALVSNYLLAMCG